jgi:hypothetical protein
MNSCVDCVLEAPQIPIGCNRHANGGMLIHEFSVSLDLGLSFLGFAARDLMCMNFPGIFNRMRPWCIGFSKFITSRGGRALLFAHTHTGDASLGQRCHDSALDITIGWFRAVLRLATETDPIRAGGGGGGHTRVGLGFVLVLVLVLPLFISSSTVSWFSLVDVFSTTTPMVVLSSQQHPH